MWAMVTTGAVSLVVRRDLGAQARPCDDTGAMSWLDVLLLALLGGSLYTGYRRGAVLQVIGLGGLIVGVAAGVAVAPRIARFAGSPATAVALVLGTVLIAGAMGNMLGWATGSRLRRRTHEGSLRRVDAVGGSAISAIALLLATWFLALNLAEGPFPAVSRGLRESEIVRRLDSVLPAPPSLVGEASRLLALLGFPDVFVGLPQDPSAPVDPPAAAQAKAATRAAVPSTVEVLGTGCNPGFVNQGSGFVVGDELVITNAHVVAGTAEQWVQYAGVRTAATVVSFDPQLDVALLRARGLDLPPLPILGGEAGRGDAGAVLGYPGGGPLDSEAAAVRGVIEPVGRNIYGQGQVRRRVYEVQATIRRGNSGGPFVLASGRVAGLVFASSVADGNVGYAIVSSEFVPMLQSAQTLTASVGTGACAG
jgi:S1-C subfamily serine protease